MCIFNIGFSLSECTVSVKEFEGGGACSGDFYIISEGFTIRDAFSDGSFSGGTLSGRFLTGEDIKSKGVT